MSDAGGGGCSRKLDAASLVRLLQDSYGDEIAAAESLTWHDAYHIQLPPDTRTATVSVDALYASGLDATTFGCVAATHALSDVYASLSEPILGTVALGVTREAVTAGRAAATLKGIRKALSEAGAVLAGGHTLVAHEVFAAVTVVGGPPRAVPSGEISPGDALVLTKSLGTGLALTAMRLGPTRDADVGEAQETMLQSNRDAADWLADAAEPGTGRLLRAVTDVSGFGLLHALRSIMGNGHVQLDGSAIPILRGAADWVSEQAWSGLLDANLAESQNYTVYESAGRTALLQAVLNDPQTSGGLLAVINPEHLAPDILAARDIAVIGSVASVTGPLRVTVTSEAG